MTHWEFILRILVATGAGAIIGLERQLNNKSAGFRTNTLVALGACMFVLAGFYSTQEAGDPSRIIGQVASGMGFLGAGVIFRHGVNVQGLTTAATLWCSAALGCFAALGFYWQIVVCTVLVVFINISFKITDQWIFGERTHKKEEDKKEFFE